MQNIARRGLIAFLLFCELGWFIGLWEWANYVISSPSQLYASIMAYVATAGVFLAFALLEILIVDIIRDAIKGHSLAQQFSQ